MHTSHGTQQTDTYLCDICDVPTDGKDPFVDTWDDLANTGLDAGLVAKVSDVFTTLSYDDARVFCTDEGTEGESLLRVWRRRRRLGIPGF